MIHVAAIDIALPSAHTRRSEHPKDPARWDARGSVLDGSVWPAESWPTGVSSQAKAEWTMSGTCGALSEVVVRSWTNSLLLMSAVGLAGGVSYLATFSRVGPLSPVPATSAVAVTLLGCLPALWLSRLLFNGVARQLAVVMLRLGILLPSLALLRFWEGDERNCFLTALLACYFVALPLESWLLIQDLRRSEKSAAP